MSKFNDTEYKNRFIEKNYDRINFIVEKGDKAKLEAVAKKHGKSLNAFIRESVYARIVK